MPPFDYHALFGGDFARTEFSVGVPIGVKVARTVLLILAKSLTSLSPVVYPLDTDSFEQEELIYGRPVLSKERPV